MCTVVLCAAFLCGCSQKQIQRNVTVKNSSGMDYHMDWNNNTIIVVEKLNDPDLEPWCYMTGGGNGAVLKFSGWGYTNVGSRAVREKYYTVYGASEPLTIVISSRYNPNWPNSQYSD